MLERHFEVFINYINIPWHQFLPAHHVHLDPYGCIVDSLDAAIRCLDVRKFGNGVLSCSSDATTNSEASNSNFNEFFSLLKTFYKSCLFTYLLLFLSSKTIWLIKKFGKIGQNSGFRNWLLHPVCKILENTDSTSSSGSILSVTATDTSILYDRRHIAKAKRHYGILHLSKKRKRVWREQG